MTPSLLLSPAHLVPLPTSPSPDIADCPTVKRNVALTVFSSSSSSSPPFGVASMSKTRMTMTATGSTTHADASAACTHARRQWTGMPIRAILPLPRGRQKHAVGGSNGVHQHQQADVTDATGHARSVGSVNLGPLCLTRSSGDANTVLDMDTSTDMDADDRAEREVAEEDEEDGDCDGDDTTRCYSYESITAAKGLSSWSFEELRAECYAQSLIARGSKPPPVVQPSLAIPPAFVPRVILRSQVAPSPRE